MNAWRTHSEYNTTGLNKSFLLLENAKVLKLEHDNQFHTKYVLEREDTQTNYLIYAPFPKPALRENHLADAIRYSKEFSDLGVKSLEDTSKTYANNK